MKYDEFKQGEYGISKHYHVSRPVQGRRVAVARLPTLGLFTAPSKFEEVPAVSFSRKGPNNPAQSGGTVSGKQK